MRRGEPGRDFYVLLSGRLDVILTGADGRQLPVGHLEPGASFGEMSLLTGMPVSTDIVARGPAEILVYPGRLLRRALSESEDVRERVLSSFIRGVRRADTNVWCASQRTRALEGLAGSSAHAGPLVATSAGMLGVQKRLPELAADGLPVLVSGERGTGKLFVARRIHEASSSPAAPCLVVDCSHLADAGGPDLIFGSATDDAFAAPAADGSLPSLGALHLAHGGTLILQNLNALDAAAQDILIRYLDALSSRADVHPRVRVVGTLRTNPSLPEAAAALPPALQRHFLKRTLQVPSLRDRKRDILPLARLFLEDDNRRQHGRERRFAGCAERALVSSQYRHRNVAELRETVESAAVLTDTPEIRQEHVFTGPREASKAPEFDLAGVPLVMAFAGGKARSVARAGVLSFFAALALACLFAGGTAAGGVANALVWGVWWPSLMLLFLFVGRVWCAVCPVSTAGRLVQAAGSLKRATPGWIRRHSDWLMAGLLGLIAWSEHVFRMGIRPEATGFLLLGLVGCAAASALLYEREAWCRYLCPLGGLSAGFAPAAPIYVHADPNICGARCTTHACFKGAEGRPGCPVFHHPLYARDAHFCKLCLQCIRGCPNGSARLFLRPPLWSVWGLADLSPLVVPVALTTFFLSLGMLAAQGEAWIATAPGFTVTAAAALVCAAVLRPVLPRLIAPGQDPDPALLARAGVALMILGWGPLMAFHAAHVPGLSSLDLATLPGSFWQDAFRLTRVPITVLVQSAAVLFAAILSAFTFWRIRAAQQRAGGGESARGWFLLASLCVVYVAVALILIAGPCAGA